MLLLENGVATLDASATSPDHAVSIEPFLVERIEAVRGPASLQRARPAPAAAPPA
jgi:iron complex outermembrane receptor protein